MHYRFSIRSLLFFLIIFCGPDYAGAQILIDLDTGDTTSIINQKHNYDSALLDATVNDQPDSMIFFLNAGADPNASTSDGITALMYASEAGNIKPMKILLLNGAGIETTFFEGATPLIFAVRNKQFKATELLLEEGANPDAMDQYGLSPLLYASALNCYEIADLLIYFGADKEITDRDKNTALISAVYWGNIETADVLLQDGVNPDHADAHGNTPVLIAAQFGDTAMIGMLLEYHANPNAVNNDNYTPLAMAVKYDWPDATEELISNGADIHHKLNSCRNIYDLSVESNCRLCNDILKEAGAKPLKKPDFSEMNVIWGNSFGKSEYIIQTRISLVDKKFGFFFNTGFDFRPAAQKIQLEVNDTLNVQYMERRTGWSIGAGKYFTVCPVGNTGIFKLYLSLNGYLSFSEYRGLEEKPPATFTLIPSAGGMIEWQYFGFTAGIDRYQFGTLYEKNWKLNLSAFIRFSPREIFSPKKSITW